METKEKKYKSRIAEAAEILRAMKSSPSSSLNNSPMSIRKTQATIEKPAPQFYARSANLTLRLRMRRQLSEMEAILPPNVDAADFFSQQEQEQENENSMAMVTNDTPPPVILRFKSSALLLTKEPSVDIDEYCAQIWNKDYWDIVESKAFNNSAAGFLEKKVDALCSKHESTKFADMIKLFFSAGRHHTDFVQLNRCNVSNDVKLKPEVKKHIDISFGKVCRFCLGDNPIKLVQFLQVNYDANGNKIKTQRMPNISVYACKGCYIQFMKIVAVYHHLWSVSYPLSGYGYQGYECLPQLKFEFGSDKTEDRFEAYDHFTSLLKDLS